MRIKLGTFEITDGSDLRTMPADLELDGARIVQPGQFLRAAAGKFFDRGNVTTTIRFRIYREHSDVKVAMEFMLSHYLLVPASGLLDLMPFNDVGLQSHYYLADAVVDRISGMHLGCSTTHSYSINGGRLTTVHP